MNPPSRNGMWRFGFPNPVDVKDNELWCGGVKGNNTPFYLATRGIIYRISFNVTLCYSAMGCQWWQVRCLRRSVERASTPPSRNWGLLCKRPARTALHSGTGNRHRNWAHFEPQRALRIATLSIARISNCKQWNRRLLRKVLIIVSARFFPLWILIPTIWQVPTVFRRPINVSIPDSRWFGETRSFQVSR